MERLLERLQCGSNACSLQTGSQSISESLFFWFQDEYKKQNEELRRENERLAEENRKIFNQKLQDQEVKIADLTKEVNDSRKLASSLSHEKT